MKNKGKYVVLSTVMNHDVSYVIVYIENAKERYLKDYSFVDYNEAEDYIKNNKKELDDYVTNLKEEEKRIIEEEKQRRIQQEEAKRIKLEQEKKRRKRTYDTKRFIAGFMAGVVTLVGGHFAGVGVSSVIKNIKGESTSTSTEVNSDDVIEKEFINYLETKEMLTDERKNEGVTLTEVGKLIKEFRERLNLKADEYYKQELYKEVVDIDKFLELSDEEQLSYALNMLRNNGFVFNADKYSFNYDENTVITEDTEVEELTTEEFEKLCAVTIKYLEDELKIKVSREDIIKMVMAFNNDQLSQDNKELISTIVGEQITDEVLLDALNVQGAWVDAIRAAYNRGEDITKYFVIDQVIFNKEQKAMTQEVQERFAEVIKLADDKEKFNEKLKPLLLDLWNSDSGIYAMESGVGYNLQTILKPFREIYGTVLNLIDEENMQIMVRLVTNATDKQDDKDNCMAGGYYRQMYTNINGTCEKVLKRG